MQTKQATLNKTFCETIWYFIYLKKQQFENFPKQSTIGLCVNLFV